MKIILNWRGGRQKVMVDLNSICTILGQETKCLKSEVCPNYFIGWKLETWKRMKSREAQTQHCLNFSKLLDHTHHTTATINLAWWQRRMGLKLNINCTDLYIISMYNLR